MLNQENVPQSVFLLLSLFDGYIFNKAASFIQARMRTKRRSTFAFVFALSGAFVIAVHVCAFLVTKNQNLLQMFNLRRAFTQDELDGSYARLSAQWGTESENDMFSDSGQKLMLLNYGKKLFEHPARRRVYDKYHEIDPNYVMFLQSDYIIARLLHIGTKYLIFMLSALANSVTAKRKSELKWVVLCVIMFMLIEVDTLYRDTDGSDILDVLLPTFTIADRLELLKVLMIPATLVVKHLVVIFTEHRQDAVLGRVLHLQALISQLEARTCDNSVLSDVHKTVREHGETIDALKKTYFGAYKGQITDVQLRLCAHMEVQYINFTHQREKREQEKVAVPRPEQAAEGGSASDAQQQKLQDEQRKLQQAVENSEIIQHVKAQDVANAKNGGAAPKTGFAGALQLIIIFFVLQEDIGLFLRKLGVQL